MGQTGNSKIVLHVASVAKEEATDYCTTGMCSGSATRFTIGGYSHDTDDGSPVEYVLDCVETIGNEPKPHITIACPRVHAHKEYDTTLNADSVCFAGSPIQSAAADQPPVACYSIKSEKEVQHTLNSKPRPSEDSKHPLKK